MVNQFAVRIAKVGTARCCNPVNGRAGFTVVELLVTISVLLTAMTFLTTLSFHVRQIWKDIRQQQIAVSELSNQLERLTRMSRAEVETELAVLQVSPGCSQSLRQPVLSGKLLDDELGVRLTLAIDWKRRHPGKPIQLSGWLNPPPTASRSEPNP